MKLSQQFSLSAYNLWRRKKTSIQCVALVSLTLLLVFVCSFFVATLVNQLNDSLDNYASKNHIQIQNIYYDDYSNHDTVLLNSSAQAELKSRFPTVGDIFYYQTLNMTAGWPTENDLILDGVAYSGDGTNSEFWLDVIIKEIQTPTFSQGMLLEFSKKFPNEKLIKYGRDIENPNEVLFPEEYLVAYDLTAEELLSANSVTFSETFTDAKVVGIINSNISMLAPAENGDRDRFVGVVLFVGKAVDLTYGASPLTVQQIELNSTRDVDDILGYLESQLGGNYRIWFGNTGKKNQLETTNKILIFVENIVAVLISVVGVALVVILYSILEHSAKQKGPYFGMMRAMGLKNQSVIMFFEILILTFVSIAVALAFSAILVAVLDGLHVSFSWTMYYTFSADIPLFVIVFSVCSSIILALNILLAFLSARMIKTTSIVSELKGA